MKKNKNYLLKYRSPILGVDPGPLEGDERDVYYETMDTMLTAHSNKEAISKAEDFVKSPKNLDGVDYYRCLLTLYKIETKNGYEGRLQKPVKRWHKESDSGCY